MMVGELRRISAISQRPAPPWPISLLSSNGVDCSSPVDLAALQLYLPSDGDSDGDGECDSPVDIFSCDEFRMYEFKVRRCSRGRSHDWTDCPYAHPGEKARRRDPRRFHYSGSACADYRKGNCKKGDCCEFAHGVFECWLHPARYRTQPCKDGTKCRRRVCFFAHTPEQLRLVPEQAPPVPACQCHVSDPPPAHPFPENGSPMSTPPLSPVTGSLSRSLPSDSVNEMMVRLRGLRLGGNVATAGEPWALHFAGGMGFPGSLSLPATPSAAARKGFVAEKKPVVVEEEGGGACDGPDVWWVSDLVK